MGGVLIVVANVVPTLLWADLSNRFVWIAVLSAGIWRHRLYRRLSEGGAPAQSRSDRRGPSCHYQFLVATFHRGDAHRPAKYAAVLDAAHRSVLQAVPARPGRQRLAPHAHRWPLAFLPFIIFVAIVIVGSSNAVNLTDGLDGLAIGCTVIAAGALTVLTYVSGHA